MIKFILFILFFGFLLVFLLGFSIIRSVKNVLFGSSSKAHASSRRSNGNHSSGQQRRRPSANKEYAHSSSRKKIFAKDEGEYVDYEEVK